MKIKILEYDEDHLANLIKLFREVVHSVNANDYTKNQLDHGPLNKSMLKNGKAGLKIIL